jgi:hypothetical protein
MRIDGIDITDCAWDGARGGWAATVVFTAADDARMLFAAQAALPRDAEAEEVTLALAGDAERQLRRMPELRRTPGRLSWAPEVRLSAPPLLGVG